MNIRSGTNSRTEIGVSRVVSVLLGWLVVIAALVIVAVLIYIGLYALTLFDAISPSILGVFGPPCTGFPIGEFADGVTFRQAMCGY